MNFKSDKLVLIACIMGMAFVAISSITLLNVYSKFGLTWDFTDIYLTGQSYINPAFLQQHLPIDDSVSYTLDNVTRTYTPYFFITPSHLYISIVREPMTPIITALISLISHLYTIQIYVLLMLILLAIVSLYVSKIAKVNALVVMALLFSPYVLQWTVLYTGQEVLSIVFILIALGLLIRKSPLSGAALALVALTKYPGLILFPLILFLYDSSDKKGSAMKIGEAALLFFLVTLPWLIFNQIYFGSPFISYVASFLEAGQGNTAVTISQILGAMLQIPVVLLYPLLILIGFFAAIMAYKRIKAPKGNKAAPSGHSYMPKLKPLEISAEKIKGPGIAEQIKGMRYEYKLLFSYLMLSAIAFVGIYNNVGQPERFGYMLYAGFAVFAAMAIESASKEFQALGKYLPYLLCGISFVIIAYLYISLAPTNYQGWNEELSANNATLLSGVASYYNSDFVDCSVVSNAWPFLNYYNITAYEANSGCSTALLEYPIVIFSTFGAPSYCGASLNTNLFPADGYIIQAHPTYLCQMPNKTTIVSVNLSSS